MKKIIEIEGMSCEHCANTVKTALESIDAVKSAKVVLKKKTATVKLNENIDNETIISAIKNAGFQVTSIIDK